MPVIFTFTVAGEAPTVGSLLAKTWCQGERVDLTWEAPTGVTVTEYRLKRSKRTFALFVDDDTELIYTGTAESYSDTGLEGNVVYYYTLFWTDDGVTYYVSDASRVAGLSIEDYADTEGAHYLYDTFIPEEIRRLDALAGTDQYVLRRYMDVIQCGVNLLRGQVAVMVHLTDADDMLAGRLSEAANQDAALVALNKQLGFPPQRALGLEVMRRVALGITFVRKSKGLCSGLIRFIKLLSTWDATCREAGQGGCGGGLLFRTWDGISSLVTSSDKLLAVGGTIDSAAGVFTDSAAAWVPTLYREGLIIDGMGNVFCVEDNTATVVTLEDTAGVLEAEYTTTLAVGGTTITLTRAAGAKPFMDAVFQGYEFKDSAGTVRAIVTTTASADGLTLTLVLDGAVVSGSCSIAYEFEDEPQTYANRRPALKYTLYHGEHSFLWNPAFDLRLAGTVDDPFDYLWGGGAIVGGVPFGESDVIMWIDSGVAEEVSTTTSVTAAILEDTTQAWTVDEFVGHWVNPNRNQTKLFKVLSNTATQLIVAPSEDMTMVSDSTGGDHYFILEPHDAIRYEALVSTIHRFVPHGTRVYVFFS